MNDDDIQDQLNRITERLTALEQLVHNKRADLDNWPEIPEDTLTKCREYYEETPHDDEMRQRIAEAEQAAIRYQERAAEAIEAARLIARTADNKTIREAATKWRTFHASTAWDHPLEKIQQAQQERAEAAHKRMRAKAKEEAMRAQIRERLESALYNEERLPLWFTTALGTSPRAENSQQWLETAVDLIVYRIVFNVDSKVEPFGDPPKSEFQRTHLDRLTGECSVARRSPATSPRPAQG